MQLYRVFLNRLQDLPDRVDTVVVIDVLRSFTTAAVAFARGARAIYPVEGLAEAIGLAAQLPNAVSIGALGGGAPAPGFDFGNSPSAIAASDFSGRDVVMSTAAGVRGLQRFAHVPRVLAASLVCAKATVNKLRAEGAERVAFVITGEWVDRDGDEDIVCADYLEALLAGAVPDRESVSHRVRESDFGRQFGHRDRPFLPMADLELAVQLNCYDRAMVVERENGRLVIR